MSVTSVTTVSAVLASVGLAAFLVARQRWRSESRPRRAGPGRTHRVGGGGVALDRSELERRGRACGADGVLEKVAGPRALVDQLESWLRAWVGVELR